MSVWSFIEQVVPSEKICPWWLWDQLITVPRDALNTWDVFRGHFLSHLAPYLNRPVRTVTMLRDPVERSLSHYFHVRRAPEHPFHQHARSLTLAEFCLHPDTRSMIENYQASHLATAPRDPAEQMRGLSEQDLARFQLQLRMEQPDTYLDGTKLLEAAHARLLTFAAVGITERLYESLSEASRILDCEMPAELESRNINPERVRRSEVDSTTIRLIQELTEVDQNLYNSAVAGAFASQRVAVPA